ncbi:hypothetical protein ACFY5D_01110 [Paeniglutamicibacter sp. NPDC012692]|uniref:hypothetical protein n=1 Tax=Paeniglutamicibacter sp. NPDC012692 TaxID=3364388 RepID=UPI00369E1EBE
MPTIATLMMVMLAVASMFNGPHEQWGNALPFLMLPLVYSAAAVMFYKMLRCRTFRKTWLWATLFIVVVGAASTPAVWATTGAVVEEWCESQPGGRGYPSNASSTEVPRACG